VQLGEDGLLQLLPRSPPDPPPVEAKAQPLAEVDQLIAAQPKRRTKPRVRPIAPAGRKPWFRARPRVLTETTRASSSPALAPSRLPKEATQPSTGSALAHSRLIAFEEVSLHYGGEIALQDINLAVDPGELLAIVGPSGAGKTSTLRLLQGLVRPTSGRLWIDGVPVHRAWPFRLRRLRRRIGVVFQDYRLLANRSALENVAFALQISDLSVPRSEARHRAAEQLKLVGLGRRMKALPEELSGGQQQRMAIARALVTSPRILLADEPTASLDEVHAKRILLLFKEISNGGTTVVIATHDRMLLNGLGARIVRLSKGRLVSDRRTRGKLWVMR
jgi:cell division transport system ATP-binding protein